MRNKRWHIRRALVADPRTDPMIANSQGRTVRLALAPAPALALALALAVLDPRSGPDPSRAGPA